jgi:hypothetical protein
MYGYQPSPHAYRLLQLAGANKDTVDRLTLVADIRDVVKQLLNLSKERTSAKPTRAASLFQPGDLVYLPVKGLHIRSQKCKRLRNQRLGPFKISYKVVLTLARCDYLRDVDYILCFFAPCYSMLYRKHI